MSKYLLVTILILQVFGLTTWAGDYIYDRPYGDKKMVRIDENGVIYASPYRGKRIGKVKDGMVYDRPYGGKKVGRIKEDGKLYDKPYGGNAVGTCWNEVAIKASK